jgi:thiol-disulfide isomerase/thioredoxin
MTFRHVITSALPTLFVGLGLMALGCGSNDDAGGTGGGTPSGTGGQTATGGSDGTGASGGGVGGGGGGEGGSLPTPTRRTISGDITWNVTFDADAQMAGATDCAYTRHYEGVEDASAPWLCRDCEVMFRADVQMTAGQEDCFSQISSGMPAAQEWIGYGNGSWWRSGAGLMSEQGTAMVMADDIATSHAVLDLDAPLGGLFSFTIAGQLTTGEADGDPLHGFVPADSYSCGWPKADPAPYTGDYTIVLGQTVPDGTFLDECDEVVRLHDFAGSYLMIDMSAIDCPPCQTMAGLEEQFVSDMAMQGIDVHVITLLAPSLTDVYGETTNAMLSNWTSQFSLMSPVLADRGWGLSMFLTLFEDGAAYPSWVLVDPTLQVFETGEGFGGYESIQASILAHANP